MNEKSITIIKTKTLVIKNNYKHAEKSIVQ